MLAQMAGALVNLILDPLLIFGVGFFPEMGITGAAVATVIGQWSAAVIGLILNYVQNKEIHFVFSGFRMKKENVKLIYKVGAPTILMQSFGSIMVAAMNMILVAFSTTAVAFFGVYFKLQSFIAMPMNGLGRGILPIVGYNYGAKKTDRIRQTVKASMVMGCVICIVVTLVILLFTKQILLMFSASDEMLAMGIPALRIICLTFTLTAVTMISGYIVSGLGTGSVTMIAAAIRQLIVLLPCVLIIGKIGGISHVWYAFWISEGCALVYAVMSLRKKLKSVTGVNKVGRNEDMNGNTCPMCPKGCSLSAPSCGRGRTYAESAGTQTESGRTQDERGTVRKKADNNTCPMCPKGCSLSAPSCGRGRAYAQNGGVPQMGDYSMERPHGKFHHHRGRHR
jgi:Na+-driven multidrug efflux pump